MFPLWVILLSSGAVPVGVTLPRCPEVEVAPFLASPTSAPSTSYSRHIGCIAAFPPVFTPPCSSASLPVRLSASQAPGLPCLRAATQNSIPLTMSDRTSSFSSLTGVQRPPSIPAPRRAVSSRPPVEQQVGKLADASERPLPLLPPPLGSVQQRKLSRVFSPIIRIRQQPAPVLPQNRSRKKDRLFGFQ